VRRARLIVLAKCLAFIRGAGESLTDSDWTSQGCSLFGVSISGETQVANLIFFFFFLFVFFFFFFSGMLTSGDCPCADLEAQRPVLALSWMEKQEKRLGTKVRPCAVAGS